MKDRHILRNRYLFLFDVVGCFLAYFITSVILDSIFNSVRLMLCLSIPFILTTVIFVSMEAVFGIYRIMWRYCSVKDGIRLAKACLVGIAGSILSFSLFALWCEIKFFRNIYLPNLFLF